MSGANNIFIVFLLGNTAMMNTEAQKPFLRLEPEQPGYIVGESLTLRCIAEMPTRITGYSFFKDVIPIAINSSSNRLTISSLSLTDAGNYFCTYYIASAGTQTESQYIDLKVFELPPTPTLSVEPQKNVFVVNQSLVIRCQLQRGQSATEISLYKNESIIYEADNFGVLSIANTEKRNSGSYTCQYRTIISGRTVDSRLSNQKTLVVIDLPPTPILRYANNVQSQSGQIEIVCEIQDPSSLIHGYRLYRNGGEILSRRDVNQFVIDYSLKFDGCYSCRSFVDILGEEVLSPKSTEVFLTLDERNSSSFLERDRRSCQVQNSTTDYGLSKQGYKLYGSVLVGKLIVLISILLYFGIYLLVIHIRRKKSETEAIHR
ncbi:immunoglobulin superfamily member 1-like [Hyla sarda]|uniref:immunoglobulin superfamily member 1-like n=1 Tax=Hyla sarda TaxID=327740 RepID=UPI0024C210BE|nr:immunoglobulin superfamily member 1-like [Hyla sarda]XP_056383957.1 immunoglobulin superfamily member 1-like [Hyla sarda]XP_056383967.1 immunoglobulin superfamily member 1-like [Hyla sarda]XP_056383976.1 immunoglobulin superfamily member 1-like [Hyla sarda]XP_056383983.1 immunoglobulin superfamily member 1-like [Hyla sarda]XP_056383986.1 immunoglobulin superfamily member 1-like [Hyla sarda]XP_056383994.1 immunoglobulin superfamily member 1-like [Hyla sarda]